MADLKYDYTFQSEVRLDKEELDYHLLWQQDSVKIYKLDELELPTE